MLAAYNQNGQIVYAKVAQISDKFFCPQCRRPVQLICGQKQPFFRHYSHQTNQIAESSIHRAGKKWLAKFLAPTFTVDLEYIWDSEQRLDLYARNYKWHLAVEYQCSPISKNELARRHFLYQRKNLRPLWIFGPKHYRQAQHLKHLQSIVSYSKHWGFYVLFKLPQENFLRLNYHYQTSPYSNKLYWQQSFISSWTQLLELQVSPPHYQIEKINWQRWYQKQQLVPTHQFIQWQNWCYQQQYSLLNFVKKTPPKTMFPIYRFWPCYLPLAQKAQQTSSAKVPLVSAKIIQACASVDQAKFDNLF
uniref:competence protein CoiA n=1 Tax=Bombilactobacillus bombi TaxID=1303590 RepID=UPI00359CAAEA